ncbi:MAG: hypothetical protein ACKO2P_09620 [Planctomycetota bacterium]
MGELFLAQDTHLDRRVALKIPRKGVQGVPGASDFHADPDRVAVHGTDKEGRAYTEAWGWPGGKKHKKRRYVRMITLIHPASDDVILVTDLLDGTSFPATELLEHYLSRWV